MAESPSEVGEERGEGGVGGVFGTSHCERLRAFCDNPILSV